MSKILIKAGGSNGDNPTSVIGTEVYVDGQRITHVSGLRIDLKLGSAVRVEVEVYPSEFRIEGDAEVEKITVCPKCRELLKADPFNVVEVTTLADAAEMYERIK